MTRLRLGSRESQPGVYDVPFDVIARLCPVYNSPYDLAGVWHHYNDDSIMLMNEMYSLTADVRSLS